MSATAHVVCYNRLMSTYRTTAESFWAQMNKTGGCWLWTGARTSRNYGTVSWMNRQRSTHKLAYELTNGPVPDGLVVRHTCDNPPCCNPEHLSLGTVLDNVRDMLERGRKNPARGERCHHAKLTAEMVVEMRRLRANGSKLRELVTQFGVSLGTVGKACARESWKHVQ